MSYNIKFAIFIENSELNLLHLWYLSQLAYELCIKYFQVEGHQSRLVTLIIGRRSFCVIKDYL